MSGLTLYQFTLSPYCIKVRRILDYKKLPYRTIEVNPFARGEVVRISGQRRLPVLVDEGPGAGTSSGSSRGNDTVAVEGSVRAARSEAARASSAAAAADTPLGGDASEQTRAEVRTARSAMTRPSPGSDPGPIVTSDSTRIAVYLETICPEPSIYPSAPEARARVLMLEDWSDEQLAGDLIPFKIFTPGNARRMVEQSKGFYEPHWYYELLYPLGPALLRSLTASKRRGRSPARIRQDYERDLDLLSSMAATGGFLAGEHATVFDFAVWGLLRTMEGLAGEELLAARPPLAAWYARMKSL